jgi:hypothetical protein
MQNDLSSQAAGMQKPACLSETLLPARGLGHRTPPVRASFSPAKTEACPTPNPAPGNPTDAGAFSHGAFPLPWFREYAEVLHRLFTRVETRREQGLSLTEALRRRWYGPHWHSARRIKVRLGSARLRGLYYRWRKNGRTPQCLALRFAAKLPPVPPEIVLAFVDACAVAGVTHFSQALRLTDCKGFSSSRLMAALPDQALRTIRKAFVARRQAEVEARKLVKRCQGQLHRLLVADAARSGKLARLANSFIGRRERGGCRDTSRQLEAPVQGCGAIFKPVVKGVANAPGDKA